MATPKQPRRPWWHDEIAVRIVDLPRHLPARSDGKSISVATCFRYSLHGVGGIKLRRFKTGGQWCTTTSEVVRWQAMLTAAAEAVGA